MNPAAAAVGRAINALAEVEKLQFGPSAEEFRKGNTLWLLSWSSTRPAIAWALCCLMTQYAVPRPLREEVYERILKFRSDALNENVSEDAVRRSIQRFERDTHRKGLKARLQRILA